MNKTVVITGSSSGLGQLTAKTLQEQGWNVVASRRSPEKERGLNQLDNVLVTKLDVTDKESIENAVSQTTDTPVHNIFGADAKWIVEMINSMLRQNFFNQMVDMLTPNLQRS